MDPASKPAVVMDCGTGYTKMGFAGNVQVRRWQMVRWAARAGAQRRRPPAPGASGAPGPQPQRPWMPARPRHSLPRAPRAHPPAPSPHPPCTQPSFVIPTAITTGDWRPAGTARHSDLPDLDFQIGHDALSAAATSSVCYPVRQGAPQSAAADAGSRQQAQPPRPLHPPPGAEPPQAWALARACAARSAPTHPPPHPTPPHPTLHPPQAWLTAGTTGSASGSSASTSSCAWTRRSMPLC